MTQKQLNRFKVLSLVIEGKVTIQEAAEDLDLSERQIKRLKKGVQQQGPESLIHSNTGRKPSHAVTDQLKAAIIRLKGQEPFINANFTHFQELLAEHEQIHISYTPLYKILTEAGLASPKKRRKRKSHHRRKRKARRGTLIQMDATPFEWFSTPEKFTLHGAVDDATGEIVGAFLTPHECLMGYFAVARQMLLNCGIPVSLYTDRHSIFVSPKAASLSIQDQLDGQQIPHTQFSRAMDELGITMHKARSPQAKGRVEKLWDTLQSRLPVEFKIAGITNIGDANAFLPAYIKRFNERFAVAPLEPDSAFRDVPDSTLVDHTLCVKHQRIIDAGHVFSFSNRHFQILQAALAPKTPVRVLISPAFGIKVQHHQHFYQVIPFIKPKKNPKPKAPARQIYTSLPDEHYFKYGHIAWPRITFDESNRDIIQILEDIFLKEYA